MGRSQPLTNFGQAFDFVSCGLRILSRRGRGKLAAPSVPQAEAELVAPYLSPCGRGYEGRVNVSEPLAEVGEGFKTLRKLPPLDRHMPPRNLGIILLRLSRDRLDPRHLALDLLPAG